MTGFCKLSCWVVNNTKNMIAPKEKKKDIESELKSMKEQLQKLQEKDKEVCTVENLGKSVGEKKDEGEKKETEKVQGTPMQEGNDDGRDGFPDPEKARIGKKMSVAVKIGDLIFRRSLLNTGCL